MYFSPDEYQDRWNRTYDEIARRGYTSAVVVGRSAGTYDRCGDVLYLSNFYSTHSGQELDNPLWSGRGLAFVVLHDRQAPEIHMDEPMVQEGELSVADAFGHWDTVEGLVSAVKRLMLEGKVALVREDTLPIKYYRQLEEGTPQVEWVGEDDLVQVVRRIKSPAELDCVREGGRIVSKALFTLMEALTSGKTEAEAAGMAATVVMRNGGNFHMIPVSHGKTIDYFARSPLTGYSLDAPQRGDLVRAWIYGPMWQGYWLDPGRTGVARGNGSAEKRTLIEDTAGIVQTLIDAVKPGVSVVDIAALGDELMRAAGGETDQAGAQWPGYGHGLGLYFEEPTFITQCALQGDVVEANMVLGLETFLKRPGVGSAGLEQNVIVTETGTELLTITEAVWA